VNTHVHSENYVGKELNPVGKNIDVWRAIPVVNSEKHGRLNFVYCSWSLAALSNKENKGSPVMSRTLPVLRSANLKTFQNDTSGTFKLS
jgi:hypothetical protein